MPTIETIIFFTAAAIAITLVPGPSMLYVASRSMAQGKTAGIMSAFGLSTGLLLHTIATSLGLSAVFLYSPLIYIVIKYLGALYLLYLGFQMFFLKELLFSSANHQQKKMNSRMYGQGVLTEVLNPKTALFFLSFLPQFVDPSKGAPGMQMFIFGCILLLTALCADLLIAITGGLLSRWLSERPFIQKIQQWMAGTVLIGLGIRLAVCKEN
jgi:threonine/homoserine/homoserine lactone efflux protein